jgi:hypothetical protein
MSTIRFHRGVIISEPFFRSELILFEPTSFFRSEIDSESDPELRRPFGEISVRLLDEGDLEPHASGDFRSSSAVPLRGDSALLQECR